MFIFFLFEWCFHETQEHAWLIWLLFSNHTCLCFMILIAYPHTCRNFSWKHKCAFAFDIIPPHWSETDSWNSFISKTRTYCQTSNIRHTLARNKIVDHSYVVGTAPTTSSFSTEHLGPVDSAMTTERRDNIYILGFCMSYIRGLTVTWLTHWDLVTPFGDVDLGQHWLR